MGNSRIQRLKLEGAEMAKAHNHVMGTYVKENQLFYWAECKYCGALIKIMLGAVGNSESISGDAWSKNCNRKS